MVQTQKVTKVHELGERGKSIPTNSHGTSWHLTKNPGSLQKENGPIQNPPAPQVPCRKRWGFVPSDGTIPPSLPRSGPSKTTKGASGWHTSPAAATEKLMPPAPERLRRMDSLYSPNIVSNKQRAHGPPNRAPDFLRVSIFVPHLP